MHHIPSREQHRSSETLLFQERLKVCSRTKLGQVNQRFTGVLLKRFDFLFLVRAIHINYIRAIMHQIARDRDSLVHKYTIQARWVLRQVSPLRFIRNGYGIERKFRVAANEFVAEFDSTV